MSIREIGLIRLRIGVIRETLYKQHWTLGFHKSWIYVSLSLVYYMFRWTYNCKLFWLMKVNKSHLDEQLSELKCALRFCVTQTRRPSTGNIVSENTWMISENQFWWSKYEYVTVIFRSVLCLQYITLKLDWNICRSYSKCLLYLQEDIFHFIASNILLESVSLLCDFITVLFINKHLVESVSPMVKVRIKLFSISIEH